MLKNFVEASDLSKYHPNIDSNLWKNTSDYSTQIGLGFERVMSDLWTKDIDPRKVMLPVVLSSTVGKETPSDFKRLSITETNGSGSVTLQGSNDNTTFTTVTTVDVSTNTSELITSTYKYYKYTSTFTPTAVEIYETIFDRPIVHATLALIFRSFFKEVGDIWDINRQLAEQDYLSAMTAAKYYYDINDNQLVDTDEVERGSDVTFVR